MADKTKIFISWSGKKSQCVARILKDWLKLVQPNGEAWMSSDDIAKGQLSGPAITEALKDTDVGIVCLTAENQRAPWLNFESGALAKKVEVSHVFTLLLDLKKGDVTGPLSAYQHTEFSKEEDLRQMLRDLNRAMKEASEENVAEELFNNFHKQLKDKVTACWEKLDEEAKAPPVVRTTDDMLREVLTLVRGIDGRIDPRPSWLPDPTFWGGKRPIRGGLAETVAGLGHIGSAASLGHIAGAAGLGILGRSNLVDAVGQSLTLDEIRLLVQYRREKAKESQADASGDDKDD